MGRRRRRRRRRIKSSCVFNCWFSFLAKLLLQTFILYFSLQPQIYDPPVVVCCILQPRHVTLPLDRPMPSISCLGWKATHVGPSDAAGPPAMLPAVDTAGAWTVDSKLPSPDHTRTTPTSSSFSVFAEPQPPMVANRGARGCAARRDIQDP